MDQAPRKKPRNFEPPPWEAEAFEELRKRREQERAERELEEALRIARERAFEEETAARPEAAIAQQERPPGDAGPQPSDEERPPLDEKMVERMLIQLALEEPRAVQEVSVVANVVAVAMAAAGLGFVAWSVALFARTRAATGDAIPAASPLIATIASLLMMLWGFMVIGGGVLLWRRHNLR